jgi:hypothetical protein
MKQREHAHPSGSWQWHRYQLWRKKKLARALAVQQWLRRKMTWKTRMTWKTKQKEAGGEGDQREGEDRDSVRVWRENVLSPARALSPAAAPTPVAHPNLLHTHPPTSCCAPDFYSSCHHHYLHYLHYLHLLLLLLHERYHLHHERYHE